MGHGLRRAGGRRDPLPGPTCRRWALRGRGRRPRPAGGATPASPVTAGVLAAAGVGTGRGRVRRRAPPAASPRPRAGTDAAGGAAVRLPLGPSGPVLHRRAAEGGSLARSLSFRG